MEFFVEEKLAFRVFVSHNIVIAEENINDAEEYEEMPEKSRKWLWIGLVIIVFVIIVGGLWAWKSGEFATVAPDSTKYQAVFLNNGQVYFGKLTLKGKWLDLTNIYYLQVQQNLQGGTPGSGQNFQLIKLGSELHGPEDEMLIPRENVSFWENLKDDSQAVQAIKKYQGQNK